MLICTIGCPVYAYSDSSAASRAAYCSCILLPVPRRMVNKGAMNWCNGSGMSMVTTQTDNGISCLSKNAYTRIFTDLESSKKIIVYNYTPKSPSYTKYCTS